MLSLYRLQRSLLVNIFTTFKAENDTRRYTVPNLCIEFMYFIHLHCVYILL